ncbi:type II toxin-antitoxin system HicA family toxin [Granulicella sibirica]|uniref:type II toxin-antitoxin system HicA family toxin n=1 Tax=Granulicella sibirica TaxID=2479048 RepID=UPI00100875C9
MKYREFTRLLKDDHWTIKSQEGSHQHWVHATQPGKVTVSGHPNVDIPLGTLRRMKKQAGLK